MSEPMKVLSGLADQLDAERALGLQDLHNMNAQLAEQRRILMEENAKLLNARLAEEHAMLARQNALLRMGAATPPPPGLVHPQFEGQPEHPVSPGIGAMVPHAFPPNWERPLSPAPMCRLNAPSRSPGPRAREDGNGRQRAQPRTTRQFGVPSAEAAAQALLGRGPGSHLGGLSSRGGFSEAGRGGFSKRGPVSQGDTTPGSRCSVSPAPSSRGQWSAPTSGASSRTSSPGPRSECSSFPCTPQPMNSGSNTPRPATTLMVRKLPKSFSRDQLLALMDKEGFQAAYQLVYLPIDFATRTGLGYAFVDFTTPENASRFIEHFQGFSDWSTPSKKCCEVTLSNELQGFDAHVERYRNSPVMHESVPDEFKPVIFSNGERIDFPAATKPIKQPRLRASRQKLKTARRWGPEMDGSTPLTASEPGTPKLDADAFENVPDEF